MSHRASPPDDATGHHALGPGAEFDAVRRLVARWGPRAHGIGDDAAVLDVPPGERLVVSTDASIERVHFRREWLTPREIGWRATAAALSDLAAMAATPLAVLVALVVPDDWRRALDELGDGVGDAAAAAGAPIVGGDTTRGDTLGLTITVLGHAMHPIGRDGARPGDTLWVTGSLGGPLAALRALEAGREPGAEARARFAHPEPRLAQARWLAKRGARAMIDLSDGLAADAAHVAAASGVRVVIDLARLPLLDPAGGDDARLDAARSGEEYELIVAGPGDWDTECFAREAGGRLTVIGRIEGLDAGEAPRVELRDRGRRVDRPTGHDHFST